MALGIESASAVGVEIDDPKLKKIKIEKLDDPKDKQGKTNVISSVPKVTIDLTAPPEYKTMAKRKKEIGARHPSSRTTRSQRKSTQAPLEVVFRPSLQVLSTRIIEEGRIDQIGKFYKKYSEIDKSKIHGMIIKHMLKFKKTILELKTVIPNNVWNILEFLKRQAIEEDLRMREKILDESLSVCSLEEKNLLLDLVKPHLRTKSRTLHVMDKNYELVAKETKKAFEKVFLNRHMYPPTTPTTQVPTKVAKELETTNVPFTGPQDSAPMIETPIEAEKSAPMTKTQKYDTIFIDNVEIAMAAIDTDLDKFEEAFVSTQEVETLCGDTPPNQQEEVLIEDITDEKEEKEKGEEEMKESEQTDEPFVEMPIRVKQEVMDNTPITPLPSISLLSSLTPDTTSLDS